MNDEQKLAELSAGLVNIGGWISMLAIASLLMLVGIALLLLQNKQKFEFFSVEMKLTYFPLVAILLTLTHGFLCYMMVQKVEQIDILAVRNTSSAFYKLTNSSHILFNNMQARCSLSDESIFFSLDAQLSDTSIILSITLILSVILTSIGVFWTMRNKHIEAPFAHGGKATVIIDGFAFGSGIAMVNWFLGSWWAGAVSALAT
jgi:hypothetical protein